jgi:uncharacterized membrane protein (UPF0127 family)
LLGRIWTKMRKTALMGNFPVCERCRSIRVIRSLKPVRSKALLLALAWMIGFTACQPKNSDSSPFGLKVIRLTMASTSLFAEVADTPQTSANGLMFRDSLPDDHGMLFVFEQPQTASFWMKNTRIPLSIAYIDSGGKILEIRSLKPRDETPVASTSGEVAFALEVNEGWFRRNGIAAGSKISGIPRR